MEIAITIIIAVAVIWLASIIADYHSSKPQYSCNHELHTQQTYDGDRSTEYLSTCSKCGYQVRNRFSGLNW